MPKPNLFYSLIAFAHHDERPVIFKAAYDVTVLHLVLDEAIGRGARILVIRAIHPTPEPKGDP